MKGSDSVRIDAFPQKDDRNLRVFYEAKLSICVVTTKKIVGKQKDKSDTKIDLSVYPYNTFEDTPKKCLLKTSELVLLDAAVLPIPLADQSSWELAKKIHSGRSVVRFGDIEEFEITRGEINQTIYRQFISSNASHSRLLKGVEVGPFRVRSRLSQDEVEWFNKRTFQAEFKVAESFGLARNCNSTHHGR